jgi:ribokinase
MKKNLTHTIFGLGTAALDFRIQTADMGDGYTEKLLARTVDALPGGAAANCLAQISRLGGKTCWLGKLGKDWIGLRITEQLANDGIDIAGIIVDETACSPFNVAVYAGSQRRRVGGWLLPNSLSDIHDEDVEAWTERVAEDDWLVVEIGEIPLDVVLNVCEAFSACGVRVAVDVDLDPMVQCSGARNTIEAIFKCADVLIPNRDAMASLYDRLTPKELVEHMYRDYGGTVVVTAGDQGAWACDGLETIHQSVFPVKVVDTVGAGDAFHGGLVWALSKNKPLPEALQLAAQCGADACGIKGARPND